MRQIVLDTETTGLETEQDHRIIEIGCVEMVDRRLTGNNFHIYLQPDRMIDAGAIDVHGITNEFLEDKPRFADIVDDLESYLSGAELIIHNAPFDVGFLNHELKRLKTDRPLLETFCTVIDTLVMARRKHPGKRNSLDALCDRYQVDNSRRDKHGALLDAEILAAVYLSMTGGQESLSLENDAGGLDGKRAIHRIQSSEGLIVLSATEKELHQHATYLDELQQKSGNKCVWLSSE
jgi:DNA polymerase-3 subunit epsilon